MIVATPPHPVFLGMVKRAETFRTTEKAMPADTIPAQLMTPAEVARLLSVTPKTLREWRIATPMRGPAWIKTGDNERCRVRYPREAVAAWIEQRTNPTK